jgi:hypothetical protein
MPTLMPSLFKYFAVVGGILFAGLIGLNALLEPGGPGPKLVRDTTKVVVRVDPHASKVERLRAEEAALKAAEKANPAAQPVIVTEPLRLPPPDPLPVVQAAAQPVPQTAAQPAQVSAPVALTNAPTEDEAATAVRAAQEKIAAEKARKKRLARERARTRAMQEASAASRQQDQIYYGYAPRPVYGPFGPAQGGYGGGGWGQRW